MKPSSLRFALYNLAHGALEVLRDASATIHSTATFVQARVQRAGMFQHTEMEHDDVLENAARAQALPGTPASMNAKAPEGKTTTVLVSAGTPPGGKAS